MCHNDRFMWAMPDVLWSRDCVDKADMDVESFSDGILGSIVIQEGEVANVGSPIAFIAESDADLAEAQAKGSGGECPCCRILCFR